MIIGTRYRTVCASLLSIMAVTALSDAARAGGRFEVEPSLWERILGLLEGAGDRMVVTPNPLCSGHPAAAEVPEGPSDDPLADCGWTWEVTGLSPFWTSVNGAFMTLDTTGTYTIKATQGNWKGPWAPDCPGNQAVEIKSPRVYEQTIEVVGCRVTGD